VFHCNWIKVERDEYKLKDNIKGDNMIWAYLIHLGYNMWAESDAPKRSKYGNASDELRFDKEVWDEVLEYLVLSGANTIVIDLGEGIEYESHPEIAVKGAWSVEALRKELSKMRSMGLNPIPKLNFSAAHDEWLGEYARCVSSKKYYEVCNNLINEVIDIFDTPDLFHIGMDEEEYVYQKYYNYAVLRQGEYWWRDLYFYIDLIEKRGVRPWVWSDYIWNHKEEFINKMPKSVLQSNWYYRSFDEEAEIERIKISGYTLLEENGFDQVPGASVFSIPDNFLATVDYCRNIISRQRLKGFLQTVWAPTIKEDKCVNYSFEVGM
jgi:hypothetical protein